MANGEELLKDPEIAAYLKTHQGQDKRIRAAAKLLENKVDGRAALLKLCKAFESNQISVFFSYKSKDADTAKAIVDRLRKWSAKKLKVVYQGEFKKGLPGQEWRKAIKKAIDEANWFIFLLPDPKDDWDWCLFETGLFEAKCTSADRLICLHHSNVQIPNPIDGYQAVSAEQDDVEGFLRMIFTEKNPIPGMEPLNESLIDDIPDMAKEIVEAIRTPIQIVKVIFEPWIELKINNLDKLETIEQLDEAIVKSANKKALDLFDLLEEMDTWGEFRENIDTTGRDSDRWLVELVHVIRKIGRGHRYSPIHAVFQAHDGKIYRPVVCAVDRDGARGPIHTFHLTFNEDVCAVDRSVMPHDLSLLGNLLRATFRFRWEVLEKFTRQPLTADDADRVENAISRIEQDWESRNLGGENEIVMLFPDGDGRQRFIKMMQDWRQAKNVYKTGVLDMAIKNKDVDVIRKVLQEFLQQNQEFLEMAAERFSKLIAGN
jgi:hypothetical protein